jgi:hypothetical protein
MHGYMHGDCLWWRYTPRGGYGWTQRIPVVVSSIGPKRIRVRAPLKGGGEKLVWVNPESLMPLSGAIDWDCPYCYAHASAPSVRRYKNRPPACGQCNTPMRVRVNE